MKENKLLPTVIDFENPKMVATLKATVAQNATDEEFQLFAELCKATGLNPFKREVWFIKGKSYTNKQGQHVEGKLQVMTGINGYLAIANRNPQFDGMETEVIRDEKTGKPTKAICKVYRKDRRVPHTAEAYFEEYYQPNFSGKAGIWDTKPSIMIAKVAKSIALQEAFPQELNGLYTEEEMPQEFGKDAIDVTPKPAPVAALPQKPKADDLPESWGQPEPQQKVFYAYDLREYAKAKGDQWPKLKEALISGGAECPNIELNIWLSKRPIKKLAEYQVDAEVELSPEEKAA